MAADTLEGLRVMIDRVDRAILELLELRMEVCRRIGVLKSSQGMEVVDRSREERVLKRAGPFQPVYREIIRMCKEEQLVEGVGVEV